MINSETQTLLKSTFIDTFEHLTNHDKQLMFDMNMYIDYCLKKGFKYLKEEEIEHELSRLT